MNFIEVLKRKPTNNSGNRQPVIAFLGVIKLFEGLPNFLRVSREGFIDF